jgi:hypothetical protein
MGITHGRADVLYLTWFGLAVVFSSSQILRCSDDTELITRLSSGQRLEAYCNTKTTVRQAFERPLDENWGLQYLTLNIRHGDRSPVHHFYSGDWRDSSAPEPVDMSTVLPYIDQLRTFHLSALSTSSHEQTVSFNIFNCLVTGITVALFTCVLSQSDDLKVALYAKNIRQQLSNPVERGQLTVRGFMQHIELGEQLHMLYSKFLQNTSTNSLYVRSTNYGRTVQVYNVKPHVTAMYFKRVCCLLDSL